MQTRNTQTRVKAAVLLAGLILAAAWVGTELAAAPAPVPTDTQQRECERNGGYWVTAAGYCKIGS